MYGLDVVRETFSKTRNSRPVENGINKKSSTFNVLEAVANGELKITDYGRK